MEVPSSMEKVTRYCTTCGQSATKKSDSLFVCSNGHENWLDPPVAVVACILKEDKLLFGIRSIEPNIGKVNLPGGFLNLNETLEDALLREGREEIGVDLQVVDYLGSYPSLYFGRQIVNVVFVARALSESFKPGDDMGGGKVVWRSLDDLPTEAELAWPWQARAFADLKEWYAKDDE